MKRIFTSIALLCATCLGMMAQDCVFQYQGKELANGATVTIEAVVDDTWGEPMPVCNTNPGGLMDPNGLFLVNKTSRELTLDASISIEKNTMAGSAIQWCMGTDCMPVSGNSKSKAGVKLPASGKISAQYECEPTQDGEMLTKLDVKTGGKTYTVNILFVNKTSHIAATGSVAKPVAYYTLDGREVSERPRGLCLVKFSDGRVRKVVGK